MAKENGYKTWMDLSSRFKACFVHDMLYCIGLIYQAWVLYVLYTGIPISVTKCHHPSFYIWYNSKRH